MPITADTTDLRKLVVWQDPERMSGTPCFAGTRVPVKSLFDYIEAGDSLDDFLDQMKMMRKLGPLSSLLGMIPGLAGHQLQNLKIDERELDRIQAIILSMTPEERRRPELIKGSRRLRIARGSGTSVQHVNRLVKQFGQMNKLMKQLSEGKMPDPQQLMRGMR